MEKAVTEWTDDTNFYSIPAFIKNCRVVNDMPERSVKLRSYFATKIFTNKQ